MAVVIENHNRYYAASRKVSEIVFNQEFSSLCKELASIYKSIDMKNSEQEAFQDALYCFLTQKDTRLRALSL